MDDAVPDPVLYERRPRVSLPEWIDVRDSWAVRLVAQEALPAQGRTSVAAAEEAGESVSATPRAATEDVSTGQRRDTASGEGLQAIVASYPWGNEAFRIVWGPTANCPTGESNGDPNAISWTGESFGLMQLHAPTWAPVFPDFWERWSDPAWNVATAWEIYKRAGYSFSPWDCH